MHYEWKLGPAHIVHSTTFLKNVITSVEWYCIATTQSGAVFKMSGMVDVPLADPNNFVEFANISSSTVNSWVFSKVNKAEVESALYKQYEDSTMSSVKSFNF